MIFDRLSNSTLKLRRALGIQTLHGAKPDVPPPPLPDHIRNARPTPPAPLPSIKQPKAPHLNLPSEGEAENNILTGEERELLHLLPVQPRQASPIPADPIRVLPGAHAGEVGDRTFMRTRDDDSRNRADNRRSPQATNAASTVQPNSVTVPLTAEKLRKQIELGEKGMRRLDEIIEHQKRMLSHLMARDENYESPTGLPPEAKDLGEKLKGLQSFFRASNYSLIYLSIFDQFDRKIITPRTIKQMRNSIRKLIESRGKLAQQIQDARYNLQANTK